MNKKKALPSKKASKQTAVKKVELDIDQLKSILSKYHTKDCWTQTKKWFNPFGKNIDKRINFLKEIMYAPNGPINHTAVFLSKGVERFNILQGDIIKTKAAITNNPIFSFDQLEYSYYIVIPSSCSVQPNKYKWVLLTRLFPVNSLDGSIKNAFLESINLHNNKLFYLPPFNKADNDYGYLAMFEEISYISNSILQTSSRIASLSEIGWHFFNAFLVNHLTRPSGDDLIVRNISAPKKWSYDV